MVFDIYLLCSVVPSLLCFSLTAELKFSNPDFPDISGGVLVHLVIPGSAADKYVYTRSLFSCLAFALLHGIPTRVIKKWQVGGHLAHGCLTVGLNNESKYCQKPISQLQELSFFAKGKLCTCKFMVL